MKSTTILLIILLTFLLGVRLFFHFNERENYEDGDIINITHSFLQEPRKNQYGQYFFTGNVLVSLPLYPRYHYGEKIRIEGIVEKQKDDKRELLIAKNPKITKIDDKSAIIQIASFVRTRIDEAVVTTIPSKEAGLFLGIILGVRDKIDNTLYERLRGVGVLHIIAASGQNVSILASILMVSIAYFVKRKLAILFTVLVILLYSLLAGFDPPIVRASIMALLSFGAVILGRQSVGLFTLSLTGWGMVFYSPDLLEDISFQLSFLSTFGIITVKPILDSLLQIKHILLLKEDLTTTLSAQIATFPIMLSSFGSYALLSLPVNILLLWTIPPLMATGIFGLFASVLSPILAKPFVLISYPFLAYFIFIVEKASLLKLQFEAGDIPAALLYGYYLILIVIVIRFQKSERSKT